MYKIKKGKLTILGGSEAVAVRSDDWRKKANRSVARSTSRDDQTRRKLTLKHHGLWFKVENILYKVSVDSTDTKKAPTHNKARREDTQERSQPQQRQPPELPLPPIGPLRRQEDLEAVKEREG